MSFYSLDFQRERREFCGCFLLLPSCGIEGIDSATVKMIAHKYGERVGYLKSEQLPSSFGTEAGIPTTSIVVYHGDVPTLGKCVILVLNTGLPESKASIVKYAHEIALFYTEAKVKGIVIVRSALLSFCSDLQLHDWPLAIRISGVVPELKYIKPLETYGPQDVRISNEVFGPLIRCLKHMDFASFTCIIVFVNGLYPEEQAARYSQYIANPY